MLPLSNLDTDPLLSLDLCLHSDQLIELSSRIDLDDYYSYKEQETLWQACCLFSPYRWVDRIKMMGTQILLDETSYIEVVAPRPFDYVILSIKEVEHGRLPKINVKLDLTLSRESWRARKDEILETAKKIFEMQQLFGYEIKKPNSSPLTAASLLEDF